MEIPGDIVKYSTGARCRVVGPRSPSLHRAIQLSAIDSTTEMANGLGICSPRLCRMQTGSTNAVVYGCLPPLLPLSKCATADNVRLIEIWLQTDLKWQQITKIAR